MGEQTYRYEDLDSLDDESLSIVLSQCPYRLLTLALKATAEPLKERILGLLTADRKQLALSDLNELGVHEPAELRQMVLSEIDLAHRSIIRIAKHLRDEGQILTGS